MAQVFSPASGPGTAMFRMSTNLDEFNAHLQAALKKIQVAAPDVLNSHALDFQRLCQEKAPRDTHRFVNSIHTVPVGASGDNFAYADRFGKQFDGSLHGIPLGPNVATVGTNVPYAIFLEAGHSRQAPAGVFAISLKEKTGALQDAFGSVVREIDF